MKKEVYGVVYKITNKINGKVYIGQTTSTFDNRYKGDLYKYTHNIHLKRAIGKYGIDNFSIEKEFKLAYSKEELDNLEKEYIIKFDCINNGYNLREGGANGKFSEQSKMKMSLSRKGEKSCWYGKHHSEETKSLLSEMNTGENHPFYGKHHSDESREKIRLSTLGEKNHFYGKTHTEETKRLLSEKHKGKTIPEETRKKMSLSSARKKSVLMFNEDKTIFKIYDSIQECSNEIGLPCKNISYYCESKVKNIQLNVAFVFYEEYLNILDTNPSKIKDCFKESTHCKKIVSLDEEGNIVKTYNKCKECAEDLNINHRMVSTYCKKGNVVKNTNVKIMYMEDYKNTLEDKSA